jgi:hypothetical protein
MQNKNNQLTQGRLHSSRVITAFMPWSNYIAYIVEKNHR